MASVEMLPSARHPEYSIHFSSEDREWVATTTEYPSLSWLAGTPEKALEGLKKLIAGVEAELARERADQQAAAEAEYYRMQGYSRKKIG